MKSQLKGLRHSTESSNNTLAVICVTWLSASTSFGGFHLP